METKRDKIYFAADAHLGNRYMADPREAERKLVRWMDSIRTEARAIYFLGDMFDYWYEYKYVAPKGCVRFLGKMAELSDSGVEIHLFTGNHDIWMFDYLTRETGAVIHRKPEVIDIMGKRFFLAHGDEVGKRPQAYRFIMTLFHNKLCQWLYAAIHPRWTFAFAKSWSYKSRRSGMAKITDEMREEKSAGLVDFAKSYLSEHPGIDCFIFGHWHIKVDMKLNPSSRLLIIGDWMRHFSYAEWDGKQLALMDFAG